MADHPYEHATARLGNGLTVSTVRIPHLHSACLSIYCRVGSRHETKETNGLSHFLEHMFFRGCAGFSDSTALNTAMEDLGGTLDGFTMRDHSSYHSTIHPSYVEEATNIFGEMFRAPSFRDIDIEREIIGEEILDSLDDRGRVIDLDAIAHREAFHEHPLGQSIDGPRKNLRRFSVDDLFAHRKAFYGGRNMVLCFSGNIDPARCVTYAERAFGDMQAGKPARAQAPKRTAAPGKLTFVRFDDPQTRARVSFRTVSDAHADYPALLLIRRILDGGLSGRLPVALIERRGIAYDVFADVECFADCGLFNFEFAVAHKKLTYALEALGNVIIELVNDGVATEELERVRRRARIGLEFTLDSAGELNSWFGATQLFHDPIAPEARMQQLEAVTDDHLRRVAKKYFSAKRMTVAAVGGADVRTVRAARKSVARIAEAL